MKKASILSIMLSLFAAVIFAAACGVLHVQAANGYTSETQHCICGSRDGNHLPGCDGTEVSWTEWTSATTLPTTSGHYYLSGTVTVSATQVVNQAAEIYLDLNGQTVTSTVLTYNLAKAYNDSLTILDSAGNGQMNFSSTNGAGLAALGSTSVNGNKTLTIYGGTFDASAVTGNKGGLVRGGGKAGYTTTLAVYGGTLIGGDVSGAAKTGGTVCLGGTGKFIMAGGTIKGGTAKEGGNVYLESGAEMTMTGGLIENGRALHGCNVYAASESTLTLSGGTIKGGASTTSGAGGNVTVYGSFTMTGGEIRNGTAATGGNLAVITPGTAELSGGKIFAGNAVSDGGSNNTGRGGNLYISGESASLILSGTAAVFDGTGKDGYQNYFNNGGTVSGNTAANVYFTTHCLCGSTTGTHLGNCDGAEHAWTPWFNETSLPSSAGYYYLGEDVNLASTVSLTGTMDLALDLNGHTVTSATRVYAIATGDTAVSLTVTDTAGGGRVIMTGYTGGGTFAVLGNSGSKTLTIYGGTFDCSGITAAVGNGVFARATRTGSSSYVINVHGGEIIGGAITGTEKYGGAIHVGTGCTLNVTGGKIHGGSNKTHGGNVYLASGAEMTMAGGEIYGGRTENGSGGNVIAASATFTMTGGEIYGGVSENGTGGNVSVTGGGTFTMTGGELYDGTAYEYGGNLYVSGSGTTGTVALPAEIYDGYAEEGLNVYARSGATCDVADNVASFTKWTRANFGASLALNDGIDILFYVMNVTNTLNRYQIRYSFKDTSGTATPTNAHSSRILVASCTAAEMTDQVVVEVLYANELIRTYTCSVQEYCDAQIDKQNPEALKALCRAVLTYGEASQRYFNYKTDSLPTSVHPAVDLSDRDAAGIAVSAADDDYTSTVTGDAIATISANLTLTSTLELLFKVTANTGVNVKDLTVTITKDGRAVDTETTLEGSALSLTVKNLYPSALKDVYTLTVQDKSGNARTITYSAMSYIYRKRNTTDTKLDAVCRALQYYYNAASAYVGTQDDGVLKVLMIGNSFCYYFPDELYGMLTAAGIDAVVADVYYSGCSLTRYVNNFNNGVEEFDFITTSASGRTVVKNVGLEHCLRADDWDIISIQNHFYPTLTKTYTSALSSCVPQASQLVDIIRGYRPQAKLYWHQTWAFQVGYDRGDPVATVEEQSHQYEVVRSISRRLSADLGLTIVPSGDAWQIARADATIGDTLCTDTTRNGGLGDYYHDGNVGGGQYLNACTWFEMLTGTSVIGNTFRPSDYTLPEAKVTALQNAAHQAVQEAGVICICGKPAGVHLPTCDAAEHTWVAWDNDTALPTTSGYYYLTKDVTLAETAAVSANADIYLNLNGKTVRSATRVYNLAVSDVTAGLTVTDSMGCGKVVMTSYTGGGTFAVLGNSGNKTLTIYGGTFDASAIRSTGNGGFVRATKNGNFSAAVNLYGGTVIGGTAVNGGAVYAKGAVVTMTGGEVKNGSANNGGNFVLYDGAVMTVTGGTISGGAATGAANSRGGNIFNNESALTVSGNAVIRDGSATELGLNVYSQGNYTASIDTDCVSLTGSDLKGIYPEVESTGLKVGYSKKSITPTDAEIAAGIELNGGTCTGKYDDIYVITTVFEDAAGHRYYHIVTDLSWGGMGDNQDEAHFSTSKGVADMARRVLRDELGIDPSLVTVGGIHNHSQVKYSSDTAPNAEWRETIFLPQIVASVEEAIADLSLADLYIGRTETEDLTFVRRYILQDGSLYDGHHSVIFPSTGNPYVSHEHDADEEVQMVKITRSGKSPILMVNWQSHATKVSSTGTAVSADYVGPLRDKVEAELGVNCVFYQGACGNLSPTSRMNDNKYTDGWSGAVALGEAVAGYVVAAYQSGAVFEKVESGLISMERIQAEGQVNKPTEEEYNHAMALINGEITEVQAWNLYGIESSRHANAIRDNWNAPSVKEYELNVISIGDVAFVTLPLEFVDTLGVSVKEDSPYKMTVLFGYSCSKGKYMGDLATIANGGYESYYSWFVPGTGEEAVGYYLDMLNGLYPTRKGN